MTRVTCVEARLLARVSVTPNVTALHRLFFGPVAAGAEKTFDLLFPDIGRGSTLFRMVVNAAFALLAPLSLSGCSLADISRCDAGSEVDTTELIAQAAENIATQSRYSNDADIIRYNNAEDVISSNPNCCFVYQNNTAQFGKLQLPFDDQIIVLIYYQKLKTGHRRYYQQFTDMQPCPENREISESPHEDKYHDQFVKMYRPIDHKSAHDEPH
ncbi:hypothetical protein U1839_01330 [Sphingomonas sp. RT2P30]|uniref:hypothetical protein n=1 Tax=Parasphingomonas halimpatiens TaxID=3096162 RepID=UPI002FC94183